MLKGMTEQEHVDFMEKISATAIANQAILKSIVSGFPITADSAIRFVGDFVDPENPEMQGLIEKIGVAIDEVMDCRDTVQRFLAARN